MNDYEDEDYEDDEDYEEEEFNYDGEWAQEKRLDNRDRARDVNRSW